MEWRYFWNVADKLASMKQFSFFLVLLISFSAKAQVNLDNIWNQVNTTINSVTGKGLTNDDIVKGLREALNQGSLKAGSQASQLDGFYKNDLIKIPFPSDAKDMRSTLIKMGMQKQVNDFEKQLNRAAEDAARKAAPIFLKAISKMTITDGMNILKGKDDAATQFLKTNTNAQLQAAFLPIAKESLQKVNITKYWKPLFSTYNKVPFVKKVNPDLNAYVTDRAIEGLFKLVAQEELKIRKDPVARTSDILKKVFGSLDKK